MASLARIGNKLFLRNGLPVRAPAAGAVDFGCCCPALEVMWTTRYMSSSGSSASMSIEARSGIGSARDASATAAMSQSSPDPWDPQHPKPPNRATLEINGPCGVTELDLEAWTHFYSENPPEGYVHAEGYIRERHTTLTINGSMHDYDGSFPLFRWVSGAPGYAIVRQGVETLRVDANSGGFVGLSWQPPPVVVYIDLHLQ